MPGLSERGGPGPEEGTLQPLPLNSLNKSNYPAKPDNTITITSRSPVNPELPDKGSRRTWGKAAEDADAGVPPAAA